MPAGEPLLTRPRDAGEVLDQAAWLLRGTFLQLLRAVLISYLPWSVLLMLLLVPGSQRFNTGVPQPPEVVYRHVIWLSVYLACDLLLLRQWARGWMFSVAGAWLRGVTVTSRAAAVQGLVRLPAASTASLLTCGLIVSAMPLLALMATRDPSVVGIAMLTTPLLLLLGLPIGLLGYIAVAAVHLERRGAWSAMARSFQLCGSGFGLTLLSALVLMVIRFAVGLVPALASNLWLQMILNAMLTGGLVMLDVAVESVLYFTLRCRRENYDLELLAREVELCGVAELESRTAVIESPVGKVWASRAELGS